MQVENENLIYELEGYKNEAFLARDEAERKFETFKAHFVAQQALQNNTVFHSIMQLILANPFYKISSLTRKGMRNIFTINICIGLVIKTLFYSQAFPPPPLPKLPKRVEPPLPAKPQPPPPTPDDNKIFTSGPLVPPSEAKLISILTAFLMVHPLGASLDYLVSYVRSMVPNVTQATVHQVLQKYNDVFCCKTSGIGASIEHRWGFNTFDIIKSEA